jgi:small-conductance mechanosensitive channel
MADVHEVLDQSKTTLVESFQQAFNQTADLAPKIVAALVVLVVGYIVARLIAQVFNKLGEGFGLQVAAERSGLAQSMRHMGIQRSVPAIVGTIVFWLMMCVFLMAAFNILGLTDVSTTMGEVVKYIPRLLVATVIVVVGLLVASFLRGLVATSADRVGITYAEHLANACYYALALLTFILAFKQLGITFDLLNYLILIVCAGLALGYGLALGLGGRDVMAGILAGYYLRQRLASGDHVHVAGMEGTVREVGPVATVIETEEAGLVNRHTVPNIKMLNEAVR